MYGIDPPPAITELLRREQTALNSRESFRLLGYIIFKSPQHRLKLFWRYLTDRDTPTRRNRIDTLAFDLKRTLSESCRVITNYFERRNYSKDLARIPSLMEKAIHRTTPFLVVQPQNEQDIANTIAFCKSRGLALFPRGTGSFAFGGAVPTRNGIVMDLSPMMSIIDIDAEGHAVRLQPGARWADVAARLEPYHLIPVTSPTSRFSTVGGWIATGGIGLDSYAYGTVHESVLGARVVRPDGAIEDLDRRDESLKDLFGTEGQFGILAEITLRVRSKPKHSGVCLLTFDSPARAFELVDQLTKHNDHPSHVVFFDREYMRKENILFADKTGLKETIVPERDALLLHFENPESEKKFISALNGDGDQIPENRVAARFLWSDRYFPLKAQRISPGLLGTEVVIPGARVPEYIRKVRKLARYFRIKPTLEVIVCRNKSRYSHLAIVSFGCDYSRSFHYVLSLLFIQLLVRSAVKCGGHPYGTGIWNTPFVRNRYDKDRLDDLKRKKRRMDPGETLNPNKFFKVKGRFFSIPALSMRPAIFRAILATSHFFSPILGFFAGLTGPKPTERWNVPAQEDKQGKGLLHQCAQRCTSCGSCVSVCPAYHITENELVCGRSKLRLAEAMMKGVDLDQEEAYSPFQCLHCGLCEEVCQTHLPLRDCYHMLEEWITSRFGYPEETIRTFVEKLDSTREYIKDVFGLYLPEWFPDEPMPRIPEAKRGPGGGTA